jgi:pSer/pThr/pTyr-binding forkhead associated (FHA) protein
VSEGHALLEWEARKKGGAWTIRDVGSSNGTRHNGEELVREGASHDLEDGDELMLGTHTVAVVEVCVRERGGECEERVVVSGRGRRARTCGGQRPALTHAFLFLSSSAQIPTPVRPDLTALQLAAAEETRLTKQAAKRADADAARLRSWHASALKKVDAAMKAAGAV